MGYNWESLYIRPSFRREAHALFEHKRPVNFVLPVLYREGNKPVGSNQWRRATKKYEVLSSPPSLSICLQRIIADFVSPQPTLFYHHFGRFHSSQVVCKTTRNYLSLILSRCGDGIRSRSPVKLIKLPTTLVDMVRCQLD